MSNGSVDAVVLAAGESSRMGIPKLLLPAGEGDVILSLLVRSVLDSKIRRTVVVTGRDAPAAETALARRFPEAIEAGRLSMAHNPDYQNGLSGSLTTGLNSLRDPAGLCLVVADQPLIDAGQLNQLLDAFRDRPPGIQVVVASKQDDPRNPGVFAREWFNQLRTLEGDRGAKPLLLKYEDSVKKISWEDGPWLRDIDTWDQYREEAHRRNWSSEDPQEMNVVKQARPEPWLQERLRRVVRLEPIPWIRPGTLLVPLGYREVEEPPEDDFPSFPVVYRFRSPVPPSEQRDRDIREVIAGQAGTPKRYLDLIRNAVLWVLHEGNR